MLTTPVLGLQYAQGTDPAKQYPAAVDAPSKLKIEAELLKGVPIFANAAARDAALPAPAVGTLCYLTDKGQYQGRDTVGWYPLGGRLPQLTVMYPAQPATSGFTILKGGAATWATDITYDPATGEVTCPYAGMYRVTAAATVAATLAWLDMKLTNMAFSVDYFGAWFAGISGLGARSTLSAETHVTAGGKLRLQTNTPAAVSIADSRISVAWSHRYH